MQSDGDDDVEISDSEDESAKPKGDRHKTATAETNDGQDGDEPPRISSLATTKVRSIRHRISPFTHHTLQILTPADFALLNELKIKAATESVERGGGSAAKRKLAALEATRKANNAQSANAEDVFVSENDILGPRKKAKADYAERMASIEKGREGREKFGSLKGKKRKEAPSSSTNREKARNKPIMMILASNAVRGKKKASLREKQQKLRAHIDRAKKGGH